nr:hypothetical protein [Mycobacterium avium]
MTAGVCSVGITADFGCRAAGLPDNTWIRVEGQVIPAPRQPKSAVIPTLQTTAVTRIDAPRNPYAYPR